MTPRVDHVGIAVESLEQVLPLYQLLGMQQTTEEEVLAEEGVRLAFVGQGRGKIELLEPLQGGGPLGRFLQRQGEGLHHVAILVEDIEATVALCKKGGIEVVGNVRTGAGGQQVVFLHPRTTSGVLIELVEKTEK